MSISPIRVFVLVLTVAFAVETAVMLALPLIPGIQAYTTILSFVDAALLVAALCPALWFLLVKPMRALLSERGALLSRALTIQEEERAQIARDLHDELGQVQTAILLGSTAVLNAAAIEDAHERARGVKQMAAAAVEATRRIARRLSPGVVRDFGLGAAIERVCEDMAGASGVPVVCDSQVGAARFDPAVEIAAYRITQEALTNAVRHSGGTQIRVGLRLTNGRLVVSIKDNGRGLPQSADRGAAGAGLGLAGMRERVTLLGGEFRIDSSPRSGTTLCATIPIRDAQP